MINVEVQTLMREYRGLVRVLAFFAALRNYGYVDRLGNALDEVTALEALKDSIRDFHSLCFDSKDKCVETKIGGEEIKLRCPDVSAEDLMKDFDGFIESIKGKPSDVIIKSTRRLALAALAEKEILRGERC
jgi:CRISPR-associated protein Csa5